MYNFSVSLNFTEGSEIVGISQTGQGAGAVESIYSFSIDLQLITALLIVIMLCQIAQTGYIFIRHLGWLDK